MKRKIILFADKLPPCTGGMEMHGAYFIDYFSCHIQFPLEGIVTKDEKDNDLLIDARGTRPISLEDLPALCDVKFIFFNSGRWIEEMHHIKELFPSTTIFYRTGGNEILKAPLLKNTIADHKLRQRFWVNRVNACIDILITNSAYTEGRLRDIGIKSKFFRSVGGVNAPALRSECFHTKDLLVIFSAARFVSYKNHLLMIEVIKDLVDRGFELKLSLAGEGPLLEDAQKLVRDLKLQDTIEFLGVLDNQQTCHRIAHADVYLQLSGDQHTLVPGGTYVHSEGMGRSILEALTAGTFVVAGKSGALPEIVTSNRGALVELRSKEYIVDEIEKILKTLPPRNSHIDNYCWSKVFKNYEQVFYDAVKGSLSH